MNGMVSCKSCMAHNSLDSAFCKKCGTNLPADELQQAREKLEAAVADGYKIFSAGRTDEAIQIAEMAVFANPLSTAALSLKAMCHERLGQISEALECHEKVLAIDPDSMIDKIKANDLRNLLVARSSMAPTANKAPLVMALAVLVLAISIGVVIAKTSGHSSDPVASNTRTAAVGSPTHFEPSGSTPNTQNPVTSPSGTAGQGNSASNQQDTKQAPEKSRETAGDTTKLPNLDSNHLPDPEGYKPLIVNDPNGGPVRPNQNPATPPTITTSGPPKGDPPPTTDDTAQNGTSARQDPPGVMDIRVVSGPGKPSTDSSDPKTHPNGVEALLRTARGQYQIQNYTAASNSYERALRAGASPATTNQRLAQCYEKLGRNSAAVEAYNRAITALQSDLESGRGDKNRLSTALDSCKQAVKVLGG